MPAQNVDIVFVIDASESMQPCFDALRTHLRELITPLQGHAARVRFGLVAQSAGGHRGVAVYEHHFLCGSGIAALQKLYNRGPNDPDPRNDFFTDDPQRFMTAIGKLKAEGNEEMIVALDIAADFPFGSLSNTKRVVAFFSDESMEDGVAKGENNGMTSQLVDKLHARHIHLFAFAPDSEGIQTLALADRSEVTLVGDGDGLAGVDFKQLLSGMGKSISVSSLQATAEPAYQRALFGQDKWDSSRTVSTANRHVILGVGESATLDTTQPIENIRVRMNWTRAIDLDLHAFYRTRDGDEYHVYFAEKEGPDVELDYDAGIGDIGGKNVEIIVVQTLDDIEDIVFATNIYGHGDRFSDYDAKVVVETGNGERFTVPLTSQQSARWCLIARIDNGNEYQPRVINVNEVTDDGSWNGYDLE